MVVSWSLAAKRPNMDEGNISWIKKMHNVNRILQQKEKLSHITTITTRSRSRFLQQKERLSPVTERERAIKSLQLNITTITTESQTDGAWRTVKGFKIKIFFFFQLFFLYFYLTVLQFFFTVSFTFFFHWGSPSPRASSIPISIIIQSWIRIQHPGSWQSGRFPVGTGHCTLGGGSSVCVPLCIWKRPEDSNELGPQ